MAHQRTDRLSRPACQRDGDAHADQPAQERAGERHRGRFGDDLPLHLPAAHAARAEPLARGVDVPPQPHGDEHREGEQQRNRLAAEQEEPPAGDPARVGRGPELIGRSPQREPERLGLQLGAHGLDPRRQIPHRPGPDEPAVEWQDPAVAAVGVVQAGLPVERGHAVREHERRRGRPVVANHRLDEVGLQLPRDRNGVAEEGSGPKVAFSDGDEPEARDVRDAAAAPDHEHLAAARRARARQASRAQANPTAQVVHGAEAEEGTAERALAVERSSERPNRRNVPELTPHVRVEGRVRRDLSTDAEPVHAHRPHIRAQRGDRAADGSILRRHGARQHRSEHCGGGCQAGDHQHDPPAAAGQAHAREPERKCEPTEGHGSENRASPHPGPSTPVGANGPVGPLTPPARLPNLAR